MANCLSTLRHMTSSQYMMVKKSAYQKEAKVSQTSYARFLTQQKRAGVLSDLTKYNTVQK